MNTFASLVSIHLAREGEDEISLDTLPGKFAVTRTDAALTPYGGLAAWSGSILAIIPRRSSRGGIFVQGGAGDGKRTAADAQTGGKIRCTRRKTGDTGPKPPCTGRRKGGERVKDRLHRSEVGLHESAAGMHSLAAALHRLKDGGHRPVFTASRKVSAGQPHPSTAYAEKGFRRFEMRLVIPAFHPRRLRTSTASMPAARMAWRPSSVSS